MRRIYTVILSAFLGVFVGIGCRSWAGRSSAPVPAPVPAAVSEGKPAQPVGDAWSLPDPFGGASAASGKVEEKKERLNPVYEDELFVRGYVARGRRVNVLLSDGSVISEDVKELKTVSRTHIELAGKRYALRCFSPVVKEDGLAPVEASTEAAAGGVPVAAPADGERSVASDEGSWARGSDGVARLKERQTIGR